MRSTKKEGVEYIDFELIRIYRRYVAAGAFPKHAHNAAKRAISEMCMPSLAEVLRDHFDHFRKKIQDDVREESGRRFLEMTGNSILRSIDAKLNMFLEGNG